MVPLRYWWLLLVVATASVYPTSRIPRTNKIPGAPPFKMHSPAVVVPIKNSICGSRCCIIGKLGMLKSGRHSGTGSGALDRSQSGWHWQSTRIPVSLRRHPICQTGESHLRFAACNMYICPQRMMMGASAGGPETEGSPAIYIISPL